jgi:outer membrane protein assembly factor BamE (lipoprotein component of BamABCDE complex)
MTSVSLARKYITCQIRRALSTLSLGLFCLGLIGGCGERISEHGHIINQIELDTIEIDHTKKADILEALGQPSFEGAFDSHKLYYVSHIMEAPVAGINTTKSRTIYMFTFDNNNLLQSIHLTDEKSGVQVAHIDEKTPTPGDTFGVVEQILLNIRRGQAEN